VTKWAFGRKALEVLFDEFQREWQGKHQLDRLICDAHLAIALHDADSPLGQDIDLWVADLIDRNSQSD
jgi:hypothetical protein